MIAGDSETYQAQVVRCILISIERLVEVYAPVNNYFIEQENCPLETKQFFERNEVHGI